MVYTRMGERDRVLPLNVYNMQDELDDGVFVLRNAYSNQVILQVFRGVLAACTHLMKLNVNVDTPRDEDLYFRRTFPHAQDLDVCMYATNPNIISPGFNCSCRTRDLAREPDSCRCLSNHYRNILSGLLHRYRNDLRKLDGTYNGWDDTEWEEVSEASGELYGRDTFIHKLRMTLHAQTDWVNSCTTLLGVPQGYDAQEYIYTVVPTFSGNRVLTPEEVEVLDAFQHDDTNSLCDGLMWRKCMAAGLITTRNVQLPLKRKLLALVDMYCKYTIPNWPEWNLLSFSEDLRCLHNVTRGQFVHLFAFPFHCVDSVN